MVLERRAPCTGVRTPVGAMSNVAKKRSLQPRAMRIGFLPNWTVEWIEKISEAPGKTASCRHIHDPCGDLSSETAHAFHIEYKTYRASLLQEQQEAFAGSEQKPSVRSVLASILYPVYSSDRAVDRQGKIGNGDLLKIRNGQQPISALSCEFMSDKKTRRQPNVLTAVY
jgi:hypothetical protein